MEKGSFSAEDLSTIGGIATVSLLHSFIPTHWLPFSIVGRAQKWTLSRTILVSEFLYFHLCFSFIMCGSFSDNAEICFFFFRDLFFLVLILICFSGFFLFF